VPTPEPSRARVLVRAFRGTRRSSLYRDHELEAPAFRRICSAGEQSGLPLLASLHAAQRVELDKADARRLAAEVSRLRRQALLLELDDDLTAIGTLARWCARAAGDAWLTVEQR